MTTGTLYGIGVGPGDPDLITVKGARMLSKAHHVFVPKARPAADSLAHRIADKHLSDQATIHELVFPMLKDRSKLEEWWAGAAREVAEVLRRGEDACFIT
ncbi:MAG: SAM-dependent methyltransferase, partial [Planctomycetota bacterium]